MSDDGEPGGPKSSRQRIIEEAQLKCHFARSDHQQAAMLYDGDVPREITMRLQQSIIDYYWALRPLRDEDVIKNWWDDVELSEHWTFSTSETREQVEGDLYSGRLRVIERSENVEKPHVGLEKIHELESQFETETVVKTSARGKRVEEVRRQELLDPEILIDISGVLDDAASKLGFKPAVSESKPRTKIDEELVKEVEEWRQQTLETQA